MVSEVAKMIVLWNFRS